MDMFNGENNEQIEMTGLGEKAKDVEYQEVPDEPEAVRRSGREKRRVPLVLIIILSMLSGAIGGGLMTYFGPLGDYLERPQQVSIVSNGDSLNVTAAVVKKAMPSVVGVKTEILTRDFFFGTRIDEGIGTGVIIDANGYILTNSHVVDDGNAEKVSVMLYDGTERVGDVLWNDNLLDLAIVKIDENNLVVADLGNSEDLQVGDLAIAIGNPLGLAFERTVTQGIISGLDRSIPISNYESIEGLIQTDASINPGNSGGPLLNSLGEVVGINTAKIQSGEGLGFAIPINIAKPIVDQFKEKGEFRKTYLGIKGVNVNQYTNNFDENLGVDYGVYVYQIFTDTPAAAGGLKEGDIIVKIEARDIETMTQLVNALYRYRPGDEISLEVFRDKERMRLQVVLEAVPLD